MCEYERPDMPTRPRLGPVAAVALVCALASGAVAAQTPEPAVPYQPSAPVPRPAVPVAPAPVAPLPPFAPQAGPAPAGPGSIYASVGFTGFGPQKNSALRNERGTLGNLIAGAGYRAWPDWALELNGLFFSRDLDTPASAQPAPGTFRAGTQKSYTSTLGLAATAKYAFSSGRVVPYAGGGLGAYASSFVTTTEDSGCTRRCYGTGPRISTHSTDLGYHALAGVDFHATPKNVFSAEIRYLYLKADFAPIAPDKMNVGGVFLWIGYRRGFL